MSEAMHWVFTVDHEDYMGLLGAVSEAGGKVYLGGSAGAGAYWVTVQTPARLPAVEAVVARHNHPALCQVG